jgi:hypothetical protein
MAYNQQKYRLLRRDSLEHDSNNHLRQSGNSAGLRSTLIILSIVLAVSLCVNGNFMIFAYTYRGKKPSTAMVDLIMVKQQQQQQQQQQPTSEKQTRFLC